MTKNFNYIAEEATDMKEIQLIINAVSRDDSNAQDTSHDADRMKAWIEIFEYDMLTDPSAAGSIVGYYLESVGCNCCYALCPLGYEAYEQSGNALAESEVVREAAKAAGLFAAGVPNFIKYALSNVDCWAVAAQGVTHLLENPELRCYIPYRDRYLAERLGRIYDISEDNEDKWYDIYQCIEGNFRNNYRGY